MTSRRHICVVSATAALVAALAACSGTDSGSSTTTSPTEPDPEYRLARNCPPTPEPFKVTPDIVNRVVAQGNLPTARAADIGASARLSDNRLAWVFGDTVRDDKYVPKIVANSILISSGLCVSQVLPKGDGPVIPDVSDNVVHWPMSVVRVDPRAVDIPGAKQASGDLLVVLSARTKRGTQGALDFAYLGSSASIFTVQPGEAPQRLDTLEITPDRDSETQINWGAASFVDGEWAYVYGSRLTGRTYDFGRELYVARLPVSRATDRTTWRFWDGRSWQADHDKAAAILPSSEGVSQTLSVFKSDGRYVIVSKKGGDLGEYVYTWSSDTPLGPWTGKRGVKATFDQEAGNLKYAPLGHPTIPLESGKLLVSISRNTTDFERLLREPEKVGAPVFAEVEIPEH